MKILIAPLASLILLSARTSLAWDYEGHRVVNQLALASLPANFPAFVSTPEAKERIAFLAGEPDRWRNTPDLPLQHCQEPEHFMDMEELDQFGLDPGMLPPFRYDFVSQVAAARKEHPDPAKGSDDPAHKHVWIGLLPWAITENYAKLKSGFSYLKAFQQNGGTPEEIANAQANILYIMGVMGHHVGDAAQPLHTTIHHHGWVGENPNGYSTRSSFHAWIDGGYFRKIGGAHVKEMEAKLRPAQLVQIKTETSGKEQAGGKEKDGGKEEGSGGHAASASTRPAKPEEMFQAVMLFIQDQHKLLEPLYQLDKDGKLNGDNADGRAFMEGQLMKSGQMLGDIWYSAWHDAPADTFLIRQLEGRKAK